MRKNDWLLLTPKQQLTYKNKMKLYFQKYRLKNQERTNKISRLSRLRTKIKAFGAYGGCRCSWCGETDIATLTIDHINNNGADHRRKLSTNKHNTDHRNNGGGTRTYNWLKENNYPLGFQVLCFNCNFAKAQNNGMLPKNRQDKYKNHQLMPVRLTI
jgi:serine/threonine protein phosphatase PrpC